MHFKSLPACLLVACLCLTIYQPSIIARPLSTSLYVLFRSFHILPHPTLNPHSSTRPLLIYTTPLFVSCFTQMYPTSLSTSDVNPPPTFPSLHHDHRQIDNIKDLAEWLPAVCVFFFNPQSLSMKQLSRMTLN